jgi:hypothetical protein
MEVDHLVDPEFWRQQADGARKLAEQAPTKGIRRALFHSVDQRSLQAEKAEARVQLPH